MAGNSVESGRSVTSKVTGALIHLLLLAAVAFVILQFLGVG